MIYIKIAHSDDDDVDLVKCKTLDEAVYYLKEEEVVEYVLYDFLDNDYLESDYDLVEYQNLKLVSVGDLWEALNMLNPEKFPDRETFIKNWVVK